MEILTPQNEEFQTSHWAKSTKSGIGVPAMNGRSLCTWQLWGYKAKFSPPLQQTILVMDGAVTDLYCVFHFQ